MLYASYPNQLMRFDEYLQNIYKIFTKKGVKNEKINLQIVTIHFLNDNFMWVQYRK